ncbi:MAG: competence/damage-inducible protein A, partial [Candidatus Omnitrophica bacterium]|nr:competence/damage-inducible protein A [Candidatus Omnitrophota bacterium]
MIKTDDIKSVGLVCVGSELFSHIVNSNIHIANRVLETNGFELKCNISVHDDSDGIKSAIRFCLQNSDAVIVSGGLGPTFDDITREAVSELTGRNLVFSQDAWNEILEKFAQRKIVEIPDRNKKQAMVLEGAKKISNSIGTAPGMLVDYEGKSIFLLPGPPTEFKEMLIKDVIPELLSRSSSQREKLVSRGFGIAGESEAFVEEKTARLRQEISFLGGKWTSLA